MLRRQKKERQARAYAKFADAQQGNAVRLLLWRFNDRLSEEEAVARRHATCRHRRRVERARDVAQQWRNFTRERAAVARGELLSWVEPGTLASEWPGQSEVARGVLGPTVAFGDSW